MSETVKNINALFKTALRSDVDDLLAKLALSDRQTRIFEMFYVQKKDIWMISNEIGVCEAVVNRELKKVRTKIAKAMGF